MHMTLMDLLKRDCKQRHSHIRTGDYAARIMGHSLSIEDYKVLLLANLWFHSYMEERINLYLPDTWKEIIEWPARGKSDYAKQDLQGLGVDTDSIPCPLMPEQIMGLWEALGALYVAEGTAIGGALIKKNLLKSELADSIHPISFYGCYGNRLSYLWKSFEGFMHEVEAYKTEKLKSVNTALNMFNLYEYLLGEATQYLHCSPAKIALRA